MEQILQSVNLGNLLGRFQEQRMELQTVLSASDQQLVHLGVSTIGDRVRLRDACKRKIEENNGSTSNTAAVREERLSIFNPRRHNSRSQARVTARSASSNGANKRAAKSSPWTPTFVCMADTTASKTPSSVEKEILFKAGLGLKKIKLDIQDDEQTVVNKITSDEKDPTGNSYGFPQLKTCGGFEMMRCQANCRDLSVIDCSWNAKDLRSNLGGGQGKIYLRPIQKSLSTQPVVVESKSEVKEKCYMCNQDILVRKLRDHLWSCTEGLESSEDNDDDGNSQNTDTVPPMPPAATSRNNTTALTTMPTASTSRPFVTPPIVQQSIDSLDIPDSAPPNAHASPVSVNTSAIDSSTISTSSTSNVSSSIVPSFPLITPVIDLTHTTEAAMNNNEKSVDDIVDDTISYCQQHGILNPIEILRYFQSKMVIGRALEVKSIDEASEGATNFIMVDRNNVMATAIDEISFLTEYRRTLQVQFYGEVAEDYGGPRKEFFRLILKEIKENLFDNGLRVLLREKYLPVGIVLGLSIIQNGKIPIFIDGEIKNKVFSDETDEACIAELQEGLKKIGVYQVS